LQKIRKMEQQKVPVSIYAEMTPNPAVLKFVANKRLLEADSIEFKNIEEAKHSPLASRLFHFPFVKDIFISSNYIAISKYDIIDWEEVTMEIRELIRDYLAEGNKVVNESYFKAAESEDFDVDAVEITGSIHPEEKAQADWDAIDEKIVSLLDEYVKPAVESDGGNIKFLNHQDGIVSVLLQGACSGCPSSTATLKNGIENMLQQMLPGQIKAVQAVNG
jgi:Fe-S cluster biogenesis protein NfuA